MEPVPSVHDQPVEDDVDEKEHDDHVAIYFGGDGKPIPPGEGAPSGPLASTTERTSQPSYGGRGDGGVVVVDAEVVREPPPSLPQVVVPHEWHQVTMPVRRLLVTCPANANPGMVIVVFVPESGERVDTVVPVGVHPGQQFVVQY